MSELEVIAAILLALEREARKRNRGYQSGHSLGSGAPALHLLVGKRFTPIKEELLRITLRKNRASLEPLNSFVFLPDIPGPLTPVLAFCYDYTCNPVEVQFLLAHCVPFGGSFQALGLRYDNPHRFSGKGGLKHAYYHCQPIKKWYKGHPDWRDITALWISDEAPAISLSARNGLGLLLCALIGVYGLNLFSMLPRELMPELKGTLKEMGIYEAVLEAI